MNTKKAKVLGLFAANEKMNKKVRKSLLTIKTSRTDDQVKKVLTALEINDLSDNEAVLALNKAFGKMIFELTVGLAVLASIPLAVMIAVNLLFSTNFELNFVNWAATAFLMYTVKVIARS